MRFFRKFAFRLTALIFMPIGMLVGGPIALIVWLFLGAERAHPIMDFVMSVGDWLLEKGQT